MNNAIKRLVFFLLLILTIYISFLTFPSLLVVIKFFVKLALPFVIAFTIAYVLQPIVLYIQKFVKKRALSVMIVLVTFVAIITVSFIIIVPYANKEIKNLIENFPNIISSIEQMFDRLSQKFDFLPINYQPTLENINKYFADYIERISMIPSKIVEKFFSYVGILVAIPAALIYFLLDYEKIICSIRDYLVKRNKLKMKSYLADLNQRISSYIKGTFLVMLILFILATVAFMLIDLDYALFFGLLIAITDVIPYIGPYVGAVFPVGFALLASPEKALTVIIVIVIVQLLESNLITPYIQSKKTETHPLLVMLFLLIFGSLFGILGMILAIPALTIIKTTLEHYPIRIFKKGVESNKENNSFS